MHYLFDCPLDTFNTSNYTGNYEQKKKKKKKIQRLTLLDRMHLTNKDMDTMAHCNIIHLPTQTLANVLAENN